jgi:D-glycero-alpha-D-manno-heptose-7-phosphate kinase
MILVRSPLRISIGGGGTDLKSFSSLNGGFWISAAIDKYVYVTVTRPFQEGIYLKYSDLEKTDCINKVKHPIIREALRMMDFQSPQIEITTLADIPAGTGLGSSSSFTTALLKALYIHRKKSIDTCTLAKLACDIEINKLKQPIGVQDQYISAYGGITCFTYEDELINIEPLKISYETLTKLEDNLLLFFTGFTHIANEILEEQNTKSLNLDKNMIDNLNLVKTMGYQTKNCLENGKIEEFGEIMNAHWEIKKQRSSKMTNPQIDELYNYALKNGAIGGKLCFSPQTMIKTIESYKKICDIKTEDKVFDHTGNVQSVLKTEKRFYSGNMLKIKVKGLMDDIIVTPEHPFFITYKHPQYKRIQGSQKIINIGDWKDAKNLKNGDCILTPIVDDINEDQVFYNIRNIYNRPESKLSRYDIYQDIPDALLINEDLAKIVGLYVSQGSNSDGQLSITMNVKKRKDAEELSEIFKKMFNRNATISANKGTNGINLVVSSVILANFFPIICGKYAQNKHIPDEFLYLNHSIQSSLLRYLWKGDGCLSKSYDKRTDGYSLSCTYKTISFILAKQVQHICHRLGFITSLYRDASAHNKNEKHFMAYVIAIHGDDAIYFNKFMETGELPIVKRKNKNSLSLRKDIVKIENTRYIKRAIYKIENIDYQGDVYNLIIENNHSYIAEDIAVHNCGAGSGGFLMMLAKDSVQLQKSMREKGLEEVRFKFDFEGTRAL